MDINKILSDLGLDFSNPEIKRGALEAIDAILSSRTPPVDGLGGGGAGGDEPIDVEIDPDLIQPSVKHNTKSADDDVEIEDEEEILDQIKHTESDTASTQPEEAEDESEEDPETEETSETESGKESETNETEPEESTEEASEENSEEDSAEAAESDSETDEASEAKETEENEEADDLESEEADESEGDSEEESEEEDEVEPDLEDAATDEDILDDNFGDTFEDDQVKAKTEARRIKRERTLAAAKKALADAQTKNVSASLIRELEKSIAALEALTEAAKTIKEVSDEEFNQLINRVLDAIDAIGDSGLTYTSDEERATKVQEIKNDLSNVRTQNELSAEDAEKIRAEHQVQKAREKETDKYKQKRRNSFKGFEEFLKSLYRAVALQVHVDDTQEDSWSALSRRNSGAGVLRQGKRIQELPNKKIPIIDFYFDQSGSWSEDDIAVGKKAVSQLADMEEAGQIKINIYYFSNDVYTDAASARRRGSTSGWNEIVKNVISTQATNVIIMTDADMENWWIGDRALSYTVPGYVWYLWRDGENAPRLPRDLKGRGGTQQFSFST